MCAKRNTLENFWDRVDKNGPVSDRYPGLGPCWLWTGCRGARPDGTRTYGVLSTTMYGIITAHRLSWIIAFGDMPAAVLGSTGTYGKACVCHHCDNPPCVNPAHLFLDTTEGNTADKKRKGRAPSGDQSWWNIYPERRRYGADHHRFGIPGCVGEKNGAAKLTAADVREIRRLSASGIRQATLLKQFPISKPQMSAIVRGRSWRHVE